MPDAYDYAVAYLTERPTEIAKAWININTHPAGCLFQIAVNCHDMSRIENDPKFNGICGCLTQIRKDRKTPQYLPMFKAQTEELTAAIQADARIPEEDYEIKPEHLAVFAEWQRRLDKELNRKPPRVKEIV